MADRTEKEKKRKRRQDGSSKPSKRVAIEGDKQVEISLHEADEWGPVIASTPGLAIPSSIALQPFTKPRRNAPHRPGKSGDIATKELLLHSSEHPKLDYTAREEEADGSDTLLKHYIGVYDPATGKMDVMEARKVIVRGVVRAHEATAADEVSMDFRDRRNDLGQTFGTKKSKKAISSIAENSINQGRESTNAGKPMKLNAAELAILDSMADAAKNVPLRDELTAMVTASKPRPEANHQTMDPQEVYKAEKVVGVDTMKLIPVRQWMESMKAKKEVSTSSRYVAHRMQSHVKNTEKLKVLRYMLLLLDFYNSSRPGRGGRTIPKREDLKKILGDMPEAVLEGVKRKFTEGGLMNKSKSDSLIMYLCALACIVDNAIVNIWDLKEDLKLETKEMTQYFTEVGAKISALSDVERKRLGLEKAAAAQRKVAKIKCPLEYPKVSAGRNNKR